MNREIIRKIVKASNIKSGELVLLHFWGDDEERQILNDFAIEVAAIGASAFSVTQSKKVNQQIFSVAKDTSFGDKYFSLFEKCDAVLDIFTYRPSLLEKALPEEQMEIVQAYMGQLFGKLMTAKKFMQIRIPTKANSEESELDFPEYEARMLSAYDIDYDALNAAADEELNQIGTASKAVIKTGNGCELSLAFEGREWEKDCGDGDMPCGEIYIAPLEDQTNGTIHYDVLYVEDEGRFEDVTLTVKEGKVVSASKQEVSDFFENLPEGGNVVCELGLGLNRNVKDLCGYAVLDEKMAGTFHIAIGANHMFGGKNEAPLHMDFVGKGEVSFN